MATTKIRGLTVQIGADTTGLNKALKESDNSLKDTEKRLKDVEKLLKLDPSNVELLTQKQELLNKKAATYGTRLKELTAAREELAKRAESGDAAAIDALNTINREIISTEDYLQKATTAAEGFNAKMTAAAENAKSFGNAALNLSEKTRALSAAGAVVVGGFVAMGANAMSAADDLNTLAAQTGFSTAELQKFSYAADRVDVSTETITGALKKLKSGMGSGKAIFAELGVSIKNADGTMRDATAVFYDALAALSNVRN